MLVNKENIVALAEEILESINKAGPEDYSIEVNDDISLVVKVTPPGTWSFKTALERSGKTYVVYANGKRKGIILHSKGVSLDMVIESLTRIVGKDILQKVDDITSHILGGPTGMVHPTYVSGSIDIEKRRETKQAIQMYRVRVNGVVVANIPHEGFIDRSEDLYSVVNAVIHQAAMDGEYHLTAFE
ncbi:hypothetical protein YUBABA_02560 [Serratia phage vB_SmaM-Yubaba]|nr:hypothetical protein YUBABA_02560 [Serratia phage vB_SmaM-Yubaba]